MTAKKTLAQVIEEMESLASAKDREGMARFGIKTDKALGISVYVIRKMAKDIGHDHKLAQALWKTGIHEARMLAAFVDEPGKVTEKQMERWVKDFDSWDICDQTCAHLFDRTPFAYAKAFEWSRREEEFVRRSGFVLMCALAVHDKKAPDSKFRKFFPVIKKYSFDERNFVKKAVNWALRQIGKRNKALNREAIKVAEDIKKSDAKPARWIANDALRELRSPAVRKRLK